jgi:hypothetical protein
MLNRVEYLVSVARKGVSDGKYEVQRHLQAQKVAMSSSHANSLPPTVLG